MKIDFNTLVTVPWLALAGWWAITALGVRTAVRVQSGPSRLYHLTVIAIALNLLFRHGMRIGPLGWRMIPESPEWIFAGMGLTAAGTGFAIWARTVLGRNWSAAVTVKEDHSLTQRGPYRVVRHPIYSGCLVAMTGTAMVYRELGCFVAVGLSGVAWWLKSKVEETFMTQQFGDDYRRYQNRVKRLVPFLL